MDITTLQADWPGSSFLGSVMVSPNSVRSTDPGWWANAVTASSPGIGPGAYALPTSGAIGITGPQANQRGAQTSSVDCSYCENLTSPLREGCYFNCVNDAIKKVTGTGGATAGGLFSNLKGGLQNLGIDIVFAIAGIILLVIAVVVLTRQTEFKLIRGE